MIVVKIGGDIYKKGLLDALVNDLKKILSNDRVIIVHGGGDEVTAIAEKLGKEQVFITSPEGIRSRFTDAETVEIYTMVMAGKINKSIVRWLLENGIPAFGLSGIDGFLLKGKRKKRLMIIDERQRRRIIEGGYTGIILEVNTSILHLLLEKGYVPVVAPIAIGEEYEYLNVNGDRAAGTIAGTMEADSVIFLTDVEGVILNGKTLNKLLMKDVQEILPKIGSGMDKKILASVEALKFGAKEAIIASGFVEKPLTTALNHSKTTVIVNE